MNLAVMPFLAACAVHGDATAYRTLNPELAKTVPTQLRERLDAFVVRHRTFPDVATFRTLTGWEGPVSGIAAPTSVYRDALAASVLRSALQGAWGDLSDSLDAGDMDQACALLARLSGKAQRINPENLAKNWTDLAGNVRDRTMQARWGNVTLVPYGFPTMDALSAGMAPGEVTSVVARPNVGKSMLLGKMAVNAHAAGFRVLFVTPEMTDEQLSDRLLGMKVGVNPREISRGRLTTGKLDEIDEFARSPMPDFFFANGSGTSMSDIRGMVERIRPDVLFIDAAYLLRGSVPGAKLWERIDEIFVEMKRLASDYAIPVCNAVQFNREGGKEIAERRKKAEKQKSDAEAVAAPEEEAPSLEHIAGGDTIGQISAVVLIMEKGLGYDRDTQRRIWIAKNRSDKLGQFSIHYLMSPPLLDEIVPETVPLDPDDYDPDPRDE